MCVTVRDDKVRENREWEPVAGKDAPGPGLGGRAGKVHNELAAAFHRSNNGIRSVISLSRIPHHPAAQSSQCGLSECYCFYFPMRLSRLPYPSLALTLLRAGSGKDAGTKE